MLDPRIYRAGWIGVLFAVIVVAFSFHGLPRARTTSLSAQAFDGQAVVARARALTAAAPARRPGSGGDRALAARVRTDLVGRHGFRVSTRRFAGRTVDGERELETVLAVRPGFSEHRIVVVADRSALRRGAAPEATGTAALLELGRVLAGRTVQRTLVLASVSGGPGAPGLRDLARHLGGPTDAVIVLGDLSGAPDRRPWVVPWANAPGRLAPLGLRRTLRAALEAEAGARPGEPGLLEQIARLAFPMTLGGQGALLSEGVPSVLVSASGERGPTQGQTLDAARVEGLGRGVLRAVTALDGGGAIAAPARYLVWSGQVVPAWAVRLLCGALFLPLLLGLVDGLARVSRRRGRPLMWLRWAAVGVVPGMLVVLGARAAGLLGLLDVTPGGAVGAGARSGPAMTAALVLVVLVLVGGWTLGRRLVLRLAAVRGDVGEEPGAGGAALAVAVGAGLVLWAVNPFAAALALPALHGWLWAVTPVVRPRRGIALALAVLGILPAVAIGVGYASAWGLAPLELARSAVLALAGGAVGILPALAWAALLGAWGSVLAVAARRPSEALAVPQSSESVRGPASYAGPGSLGGTQSALRR